MMPKARVWLRSGGYEEIDIDSLSDIKIPVDKIIRIDLFPVNAVKIISRS